MKASHSAPAIHRMITSSGQRDAYFDLQIRYEEGNIERDAQGDGRIDGIPGDGNFIPRGAAKRCGNSPEGRNKWREKRLLRRYGEVELAPARILCPALPFEAIDVGGQLMEDT